MQHHARRMRQREYSADASLARDEAAARRDALAQKRAKAALMRRDAKAALFRETLGELRLATAMSARRRAIRADMAVAREARADPTKHAAVEHVKAPQRMTWKLRKQLETYEQDMNDVGALPQIECDEEDPDSD